MASDAAWPAIGSEELLWRPSISPDLLSRSMRERHFGPYRAATVPTIAGLDIQLPTTVLAQADEATAEIARFDAELGHEITHFGALLLRSESASSSQIENLTAGARAIALAELGEGRTANSVQIVANVRAMNAAIALADRLDVEAILAMQAALMAHDEEVAGKWRTEQVWIGGTSYGPHQATFVPPHHRYVASAMRDLVAFAGRDDVPVLAHAALTHAQFETIHPFVDGNGRTGRALIHAMLHAKGLTRHVTVPVSAGLLADTDAYFDALTQYRAGDPTAIVAQLSEASLMAVANGRQLVADLRAIRLRWQDAVSVRRDAVAWQLVDLLLRQPVIDAAIVQAELKATSANAHRAIRQLQDAGVITEFSGRKRRRLWQAREVLSALDDFAARAARRRTVRP
ncbi:MAG TPA: Fic family protein [Jiangellaceae bacterium]